MHTLVHESAVVSAYTEVPVGSPRPHLLKWKASAHVDKTFQSGSTDSARKKSLLKSARDCRAAGLSEHMELTALTAKYPDSCAILEVFHKMDLASGNTQCSYMQTQYIL